MKKDGLTLWLTGRPASGKSTIAAELAQRLSGRGIDTEILDADDLRSVLTPRPSYTDEERDWFYGVLVFLAELLSRHGVTVLIAATGHRRAYRDEARRRIPRFREVHVICSPETCRARDPKGLYQRADRGEISGLPGEQVPYEAPEAPWLAVDTERVGRHEAVERVMAKLVEEGLLGG